MDKRQAQTQYQKRLEYAREIHLENPRLGRREIAKRIQAKYGVGLRHATIDAITRPYRQELKIRKPASVPGKRITTLQRAMQDAGFLRFEIYGVKGSSARGLGEVTPDSKHPVFRAVMDNMLRDRGNMRALFEANAAMQGYGRVTIEKMWRNKILNYYRNKNFPYIGTPVASGGSYIDSDGKPSPWALYKAYEAMIVKTTPLGGDGWGTDRPLSSGKSHKGPPKREIDKKQLAKEIYDYELKLRKVNVLIRREQLGGDPVMLKSYRKQAEFLLKTISVLKSTLHGG